MTQLVKEGSGQLVPSTTRTKYNSYLRRFVSRKIHAQDNSYPLQLVPITTHTQDNSCLRRFALFFSLFKTRLFYQVQPVCETMSTQQALATRRENEQSWNISYTAGQGN